MKKLFSIVSVFTMFVSIAFAQNQTVSINVVGNRTKQVVVDGTTYTINNTTSTAEQSVVLNNLATGQHSMEIFRTNQYNNRTASTATTFTLREGFDMDISVNANGTVSLSEKRSWHGRRDDGSAISSAQFTRLYNATKAKTSSSARTAHLENEFTNTTKGFTSAQARQLIQLVNSESQRFKLAKLVYLKVTDETNFSQVSSLLKSTANKNALNSYIASVDSDSDVSTSTAYTPMTSEKFSTIYNEVVAENSGNDRLYYLDNFFSKDFNYYTSAQARQLIQLLSSEVDRLTLTKEAYRGITDRSNYYNEVSGLLYSTVNRNELRTHINTFDNNNGNTTSTATIAMSASSFNTLYNNIYYTNGTTARYNALNNAFITTGNYFTAAQARQLITLVSDENSRLAMAKTAYRSLVDRPNYTVFNDLFNYQSSRNELDNYVLNYSNTGTNYPGTPMSDADFNTLYSKVNSTWNSSSKYTLVSDAFLGTTNRFTSSQVRQLLLLINTESERLVLAKASYDNLTDQYSYTQLYDVFSTTESRNELARYVADIQSGGTGVSNRVAMSDNDFRSIVRNVQYTFGLGAKFSSLTDIFNKETNYFTVVQAKELIEFVSAESNRLALSKLAWNNLTDPLNISLIYDVFSSQSSKDELASYIANNPYR